MTFGEALTIYGIKPWFQKQLQPLAQALSNVPPDALTWAALGAALGAAALIYCSYERPALAALAVPLLMIRLVLNAIDGMITDKSGSARAAAQVINDLSDRLSDVAIFLAPAFWPDIKVHLVLLGITAMLIVSYVGVLGKAAGAGRIHSGVLGKSERMIILMVACLLYPLFPEQKVFGFGIFEAMFVLFIPLASITLLQRLDKIFAGLANSENKR